MKSKTRPTGRAAIERMADILESAIAHLPLEERKRHLEAFHQAALRAGQSRRRTAKLIARRRSILRPAH